jgi:hypothetical protein
LNRSGANAVYRGQRSGVVAEQSVELVARDLAVHARCLRYSSQASPLAASRHPALRLCLSARRRSGCCTSQPVGGRLTRPRTVGVEQVEGASLELPQSTLQAAAPAADLARGGPPATHEGQGPYQTTGPEDAGGVVKRVFTPSHLSEDWAAAEDFITRDRGGARRNRAQR